MIEKRSKLGVKKRYGRELKKTTKIIVVYWVTGQSISCANWIDPKNGGFLSILYE